MYRHHHLHHHAGGQVITLNPSNVDAGSGPGGAQTGWFTFTCDPTAGLATATIRITRNGIVVGTIDYPLYPIYSFSAVLNRYETNCTPKMWNCQLTATLLWPPNYTTLQYFGACTGSFSANSASAVFTFTVTTLGVPLFNGSCTQVPSIVYVPGYIAQGIIASPGIGAATLAEAVGVQCTVGFQVSPTVILPLPTFVATWNIFPA